MKTGASLKNRQGGAVAVMVGISMVLLVGFLAMVIDLGRLYVAKTGLQNAADAAALSGAKELDGTGTGICCGDGTGGSVRSAAYMAINTARRNTFFGNGGQEDVVITEDNVWVSTVPNPETDSDGTTDWVPANTAKDQANNNYFFIKVDTASGNLTTRFAPIWNIFTTSTFGMAVAGRFMTNIAPLGVCAIDTAKNTTVSFEGGSYQLEYGFAYGVNYDIGQVNEAHNGVGNGAPLYLHPTAQTHDECVPQQNNANFPVTFMCTGRSALSGRGDVYVNTGWGGQDIFDAINTRFTFAPSLNNQGLDASICPPDTNIKEYTPDVAAGWMNSTQPPIEQAAIYRLADWLRVRGNINPIEQSNEKPNDPTGGCRQTGGGGGADCSDNYGVLWSYNRPAVSGVSAASGVAEVWSKIYNEGPTYKPSSAVWDDWTAPYATSGVYFQPPVPATAGVPDRRVMNIVIVDCTNLKKLPQCDAAPVLGVGRFFMQTKAEFTGGKGFMGEYAGLVSVAALAAEIRLYH